jgi:DNA-binding transcriptional regulator GbsR (MarR family)
VADTLGLLMEFWGFKRAMGRLWALLYLSAEPLSAAEVGERLSMSSGAVSMTVTELLKWGVIRRTWRPGQRRDYFEAETNIWKLVTRVFRERELQLIRDAAESFEAAEELLAKAAKGRSKAELEPIDFVRRRIGLLRTLTTIGEQIVSTIVGAGRVDTKALQRFSAAAKEDAED